MGCVTDRTTTGDNDPEIYAVEYDRHYLYCDACGSFSIVDWIEPENYLTMLMRKDRWEWLSILGLFSTALSIIGALIAWYVESKRDEPVGLGLPVGIWLVLSLLIYFGAMRLATRLGEKIHCLGVVCQDCKQQYETGSPFFTDLNKNPRNFTMADVPRPLYKTYFIRGQTYDY